MKTLIYQYWDGDLTPGNVAGQKTMEAYAESIGSDYLFEHNPRFVTNLGKYSPHYGAFKPVFDLAFDKYDYILFADTDVVPVNHISENIFDEQPPEIGICEEIEQPKLRSGYPVGGISGATDDQWCHRIKEKLDLDLPRVQGLPRVFNSGVVLWSRKGIEKAREVFIPFIDYINMVSDFPSFYTGDQNYLNAMLPKFDWTLLSNKWNSPVHYHPGYQGDQRPTIDLRDDKTNFVHIQINAADHFDAAKIYRITNLPKKEWNLK